MDRQRLKKDSKKLSENLHHKCLQKLRSLLCIKEVLSWQGWEIYMTKLLTLKKMSIYKIMERKEGREEGRHIGRKKGKSCTFIDVGL